MTGDRPLAVVVDPDAVDQTIAALKREGCYDNDRRIREGNEGGIEIPVTRRPAEIDVPLVRRQIDPPRRMRDLADYLRERGLSASELDHVPRSWAVIGDLIVVRFEDCPFEDVVAAGLLDLYGSAHTVLAREGIDGAHREPAMRVVGGRGETETVHREAGIEYALDLAEVMFAPGNERERQRMGSVVTPGEVVLDMFAGIGYFSLPMARAGARVTAIERNPTAFDYLLENRERNDVIDQLSPIRGDCGEVVPRLASDGPVADRIVMGHFDASAYLPAARTAIRPGGAIHLHAIGHAAQPFADAERALERHQLSVRDRHTVKTHGPGTVHVVVEAIATGGAN